MSEWSHLGDCESVDLTVCEDGDSRDTVIESEIHSPGCNIQPNELLENTSLPTLIPIPRVSSPTKLSTNKVPSLTKIKNKLESTEVTIHKVNKTKFVDNSPGTTSTQVSTTGKLVLIKKNNKFYKIVIPHNVMPTTCDTTGPVVINIPEVGPLVIKIDPQVKKESKFSKVNKSQEPFSLNFDDKIDNTATVINQQHYLVSEKAPCSTKKLFSYWNRPVAKRRNKCSATYAFSKKDCMHAKKCLTTLSNIINHRKHILQNNLNYYNKVFKNSINSQVSNTAKVQDSQIVTSSNIQTSKLFTGFNMLLTKNTSPKHDQKSNSIKLSKSPNVNDETIGNKVLIIKLDNIRKNLIKPCCINMVRNKQIEDMCRYVETMPISSLDEFNKKCVNNISIKNSTPTVLIDREEIFKSLVMEDLTKFIQGINFLKPLLIISVYNFSLVNFEKEFSTRNIVLSVHKNKQFPKHLLTSDKFVQAVTVGYIKLVNSDVLCSYLKKEVRPYVSVVSM